MAEERTKSIIIGNMEYNEDQLSDRAKDAVNHVTNIERKISNTKFELDELVVNRAAYISILNEEIKSIQLEAAE